MKKDNIICSNYYNQVIKNFNTNKIFYKYGNKKVSYKTSSINLRKILNFFKKNKKKNKKIVVYCEKSPELYILIQAIFLSGSVFIPISKNTPAARVVSMLKTLDIDYFIYDFFKDKDIYLNLKKKFNLINIKKIKNKKTPHFFKIQNFISDFNQDAMIYFTSGSTGVPKGTKISHYNYIKDFYLQKKHLYKKKLDNLVFGDYHETSFSIFFDIYFPAVFFGATISPAKTFFDKTEILQHLKKNKVNILITVPSTIQRVLELYKKLNSKPKLKIIIITGETFYLNQLKYLLVNFLCKKIFNCYGSTELSNWVFFHQCKKKDLISFEKYNLVPIGKIFSKLRYKLKKKILHIGGDVVSKGYLIKSQNKDKFYSEKKLSWYNTEDRVEKFKGVFVCKGRNKNIIKISGYRVDLSDVETNMRKIKNVDEAYCIKYRKNYREFLVGFVKEFKKFDEKDLQSKLKKYLPNYMIPRFIIPVKKFPLNNNGKTDRNKLKLYKIS